MNAIVFFTDGHPTAYTNSFQVRTEHVNSDIPHCSSSPREGVIAHVGDPPYEMFGLWEPIAGGNPVPISGDRDFRAIDDCSHLGTYGDVGGGHPYVEDLIHPDVSCLPTDWRPSFAGSSGTITRTCWMTTSAPMRPHTIYPCGFRNGNTSYRGQHIAGAARNLTLDVSRQARQQLSLGGVHMYAIGLGQVDGGFLRQVANDPDSGSYQPSEPAGLYVYAPTAMQLQQAFQTVASEVFRLIR